MKKTKKIGKNLRNWWKKRIRSIKRLNKKGRK